MLANKAFMLMPQNFVKTLPFSLVAINKVRRALEWLNRFRD